MDLEKWSCWGIYRLLTLFLEGFRGFCSDYSGVRVIRVGV